MNQLQSASGRITIVSSQSLSAKLEGLGMGKKPTAGTAVYICMKSYEANYLSELSGG